MPFEKHQWFALIILAFAGTGTGFLLGGDFAGIFIGAYRWSCLTCQYNSSLSLVAIIVGAALLALQAIVALSELLPSRFIKGNPVPLIMILAIASAGIIVAGGVNFAIEYDYAEWWFAEGFYVGLSASILNIILSNILARVARK